VPAIRSTLKPDASPDQAVRLHRHFQSAEADLRAALVGTRGLSLRRAGQIADMIRKLQVARLEIECERPDAFRTER
jgi:hypothetical protein